MKKVLFATTALVAFAGAAAAEVVVSGSAEMGIAGGNGATETTFFQSVDVRFTMTGETDNGLSFGATIDLDDLSDMGIAGNDPIDQAGEFADYSVFISGNFGTLTMGDTDGALDWALTEVGNIGNPGSIADNETGHFGYLGSYGDGAYQGQIVRYNYAVGDFGFAVSVELDETGVRDAGYALGFRYGMDFAGGSVNLGLGYQTFDVTGATFDPGGISDPENFIDDVFENVGDVDILGVSAAVDLDSGFTFGVQYSQWDGFNDGDTMELDHVGVSVGYTFDAFSVGANWGMWDIASSFGPFNGEISGYGLAASYDLGGGATIHAGYGSSSSDFVVGDTSTWSFGMAMSF